MKQLLSIEYTKLKNLTSLKVILLVYMVMVPAFMYLLTYVFGTYIEQFFPLKINVWAFPKVWNVSTYAASFFNLMMGVTIVIIICNEYNFRTIKQNIIEGMSLRQFIVSKFLVVFVLASIVTLYTALLAIISGAINGSLGEFYNYSHYIFIYYLQAIGYFSFAFFFAILIKRPALAIILFILSFIVEWIIGIIITLNISKSIYNYFPLNVFSNLTPNPLKVELEKAASMDPDAKSREIIPDLSTFDNVMFSMLYIAIFFGVAYLVLKRKDI